MMGVRGANSKLESDDAGQVGGSQVPLAIAASLCLKHNFHASDFLPPGLTASRLSVISRCVLVTSPPTTRRLPCDWDSCKEHSLQSEAQASFIAETTIASQTSHGKILPPNGPSQSLGARCCKRSTMFQTSMLLEHLSVVFVIESLVSKARKW